MPSSSPWRTRAHTHFTTEKASASGMRGVVVTNHPLGSAAGVFDSDDFGGIFGGGGGAGPFIPQIGPIFTPPLIPTIRPPIGPQNPGVLVGPPVGDPDFRDLPTEGGARNPEPIFTQTRNLEPVGGLGIVAIVAVGLFLVLGK